MAERLDVIDELERRLLDHCYRRLSWRERTHNPRAWIPATALSAAAGAATVIALLAGGGVSPSLAQAALNRAARASASATSTALVPGRDWYVRALITNAAPLPVPVAGPVSGPVAAGPSDTAPIIVHTLEEVWMTRDGASHSRSRITFAFANPRAATRQRQKLPRPRTEVIGTPPNGLLSSPLGEQKLISYRRLRALPASVAGLRRVIKEIQARLPAEPLPVPAQTPAAPAAPQASAQTPTTPAAPRASAKTPAAAHPVARDAFGAMKVIASLLTMPVSAPVRAALYRTAASLHGVHYDGAARDRLGRSGVAISVAAGHALLRMIFDPKTGQLLSTSTRYGATLGTRGFVPLVETIVTEKIVPDASRPASTRARRRG